MPSTHLATALVARFEDLRMTDVETVGGKNASLGEMISQLGETGVRVPGGFATTAHAFRLFLSEGRLAKRIADRLAGLDTDDVRALAEAGAEIRSWVEQQPFSPALEAAIRSEYERLGHIFQSTTDTEIIVHLLAKPANLEHDDPLPHVLRQLQGAFSLLFLFPDRIEACRDPWGVRPLAIGKTAEAQWCVASETCAFDAIGATYVRDVKPGEIVRIDDSGLTSRMFAEPVPEMAHCVFEHVYFANPASKVFGQTVHIVREALGRQLAREAPAAADYVMPMPDSGRSAALGFAKESKIPFEEGIVPNRFVGRTFILPHQGQRDRAVAMKLNIIPDVVAGKRIILVEDSVVRGTTTRSKMRALRNAGAKEIHLRVSCPPIRHPCFYGIDFPTSKELIAHERTVEQIREFLEVDSLAYLSMDGMLSCMKDTPAAYCTACWSGNYKIPIDQPQGKLSFERELRSGV